jgi:hypothetical protein
MTLVSLCSAIDASSNSNLSDTAKDYLLGGGSHLAKISAVLDWLEKSDAADNELVVMMDAYGWSL